MRQSVNPGLASTAVGLASLLGIQSGCEPAHQRTTDSALSVVNSELSVSATDYAALFPMKYLASLAGLHSQPLRDELTKEFLAEFSRTAPSSIESFVALISAGMEHGQLSHEQQLSEWGAILSYPHLTFAEQDAALVALGRIYPDSQIVQIRHSAIGLSSGAFNIYVTEIDSKPQIEAVSLAFYSNDPKNNGAETRSLNLRASLVDSSGTETVVAKARDLRFRSTSEAKFDAKNIPLDLPLVALNEAQNHPIRVKIEYDISPLSSENIPQGKLAGVVWQLISNNPAAGGAKYLIEPLGPNGEKLVAPELPQIAWDIHYQLEQKETTTRAIDRQIAAQSQRTQLIGSELKSLRIASLSGPDYVGQFLVPANGKVFIEFGATWCGPCKIIGKELEQRAQEFKDQQITVLRFSVGIREQELPVVQKEYRSGMLAADEAKRLGIDGVPFYIQVLNGKVIKVGTFAKDTLGTLKWN